MKTSKKGKGKGKVKGINNNLKGGGREGRGAKISQIIVVYRYKDVIVY